MQERSDGAIRVATFNLENLDDGPGVEPALDIRAGVLRPQLERLDADILMLQEISGQPARAPRRLTALDRLLAGTAYADFHRVATESPSGGAADRQNLAILSRWPVTAHRQILHEFVAPLRVPETPGRPGSAEAELRWDRPILHAAIALPNGRLLHAVNLHLRAPLAAHIEGEKIGPFSWRSVGGWAEGFMRASLKRTGQACEARLFVETLLAEDADAWIVVSGDFNAEAIEIPTRILLADPGDTGNNALAGHALVAVESQVPPHRRYSVIHAGRHLLLDHLLVSRALARQIAFAEIHNEELDDELVGYAGEGRIAGSYHAPVVAGFDLDGHTPSGLPCVET